MSRILSIDAENVRCEKSYRLLRCPKCHKWNKVSYQRVVDKIFVATCKRCGAQYKLA